MQRIAYVNGRYVPHGDAAVHVEDRGYQFADGIYEVIALHRGRLVDEQGHLDRLERSLGELRIAWPMSRRALRVVMGEVIRRNRVADGKIYIQVTRGVAPRNHAFPTAADSALVITMLPSAPVAAQKAHGVDVITVPDIRWDRCDIKSVSLLPNVLAKQQAQEAGAYEAWLVDAEGRVTEGTSSNAWIVTAGGELVTRNVGCAILNGVTRLAVLELAQQEGIGFVERPFTVDEAKGAREAFLTSTTSLVKPVLHIDGRAVGDGRVGPLTGKLAAFYAAHMENQGDGP